MVVRRRGSQCRYPSPHWNNVPLAVLAYCVKKASTKKTDPPTTAITNPHGSRNPTAIPNRTVIIPTAISSFMELYYAATKRKTASKKPSKAKKPFTLIDAYDAGQKRGYKLCEAGIPRQQIGLPKKKR